MADTQTPQPAAPAATASTNTPKGWPGAFGIYHTSREAVMLNLSTLVILWLIDVIGNAFQFIKVVGPLIGFVVSLVISVSFVLTILASVRGQRAEVGDAINKSWSFLVRIFLLSLLVGLSIVGGFILFIIPGLFILPRLSLAHYFLIDKNLGVMDAYKASWNATKGHSGKVWGIIGVSILMVVPSITIIGIIATIYLLVMYSAAFACLYLYINKKQPASSN